MQETPVFFFFTLLDDRHNSHIYIRNKAPTARNICLRVGTPTTKFRVIFSIEYCFECALKIRLESLYL